MKAFVTGLVLGAVALAAALVVPRFLPGRPAADTRDALGRAELAKRQLLAYDAELPLLGQRTDAEQMASADFERLAQQRAEALADLNKKFNTMVRNAQAMDRRLAMPTGKLRALATSPSGLEAAISEFKRILRENEKLLTEAARNARQASTAARDTTGVGEVLGTVKLAEADRYLSVARLVRSRMADHLRVLYDLALRWSEARNQRDYYVARDMADNRELLQDDLAQMQAAAEEARSKAAQLEAGIAKLERELETITREIRQLRDERLALREAGFELGNDRAYQEYSVRYAALNNKLAELQSREMLLRNGGIVGGKLAGDDLLEAPIEGGEQVVGIEELKRRLNTARVRAGRFEQAVLSIQRELAALEEAEQELAQYRQTYAQRMTQYAEAAAAVSKQIDELEQQAFEAEQKALKAANEAAGAFAQARRAVERFKRQAQELQRQADPQRQNERLKRIAADKGAVELALSGEADARLMAGRILTEQVVGQRHELETLTAAAALMEGFEPQTDELAGNLASAREEAVKLLQQAGEIYQRLVQQGGTRAWAPQSALALVSHLLWQVDPQNADQHRSNLIARLGQAIENRTQWPYLQKEVELYGLLTGGSAPAPAQQPEQPAEQEPPNGAGD